MANAKIISFVDYEIDRALAPMREQILHELHTITHVLLTHQAALETAVQALRQDLDQLKQVGEGSSPSA